MLRAFIFRVLGVICLMFIWPKSAILIFLFGMIVLWLELVFLYFDSSYFGWSKSFGLRKFVLIRRLNNSCENRLACKKSPGPFAVDEPRSE